MKTSRIIWYIVIAAVVYYLIYKAYTNYQISGSIFSNEPIILDMANGDAASRLALLTRGNSIFSVSKSLAQACNDCIKNCPSGYRCECGSKGECFMNQIGGTSRGTYTA